MALLLEELVGVHDEDIDNLVLYLSRKVVVVLMCSMPLQQLGIVMG